ncbi:MAG: D-alanyl-D-alanine carboxypeptidase [Cyanobacteria bacterium REEB65]|nr:D-alanyl-D-alanine carboxypeptidase [Cyanobacteria bacterium REEB65]
MTLLAPSGALAKGDRLGLSARSAIVMNGAGKVLFEYHPNERLPNASTTKVLTALVVIDRVPLQDVVTIGANAARMPPTKLGVRVGERYTVLELLYAMLLNSANDAAVALAEHVAGSTDRFARLMNEKAASLGAVNSHFITPNGLPADGHYTTAHDLALIMRAAAQSPIFVAIAQTRAVNLAWPGRHLPHHLVNHNKLLASYPMPVLGKTGFTNAAGRCYVAEAEGSGLTVAMLGSRHLWRDARRLLDFGLRITGTQRLARRPG